MLTHITKMTTQRTLPNCSFRQSTGSSHARKQVYRAYAEPYLPARGKRKENSVRNRMDMKKEHCQRCNVTMSDDETLHHHYIELLLFIVKSTSSEKIAGRKKGKGLDNDVVEAETEKVTGTGTGIETETKK